MKEVYTVTYYHEQLDPVLIGVFSTLDRAQDYAEQYCSENNIFENWVLIQKRFLN